MLRTHRTGKGTGGGCGVGLRLNGAEGVQACLWPQRAWDLAWEPSRLPRPEWVGKTPSGPLPLLPSCPFCSDS